LRAAPQRHDAVGTIHHPFVAPFEFPRRIGAGTDDVDFGGGAEQAHMSALRFSGPAVGLPVERHGGDEGDADLGGGQRPGGIPADRHSG
jgi:hypothetical protein